MIKYGVKNVKVPISSMHNNNNIHMVWTHYSWFDHT